jgi:hypothetical protein
MTNKIEEAKAILKQAGFFTDNLWHVDDVKSRFECEDDDAQEVLDRALTHDLIMERIWEAILEAGREIELKEID